MASVADLKQQLKDQLADYNQQVKDLAASKTDKLKEFNQWNADRQKDIKALQGEQKQALAAFNADTKNELAERNKAIKAEKDKAAQKQMQADLAQWQKERNAELANIQNSHKQELAERNAEITQYKKDYTNWVKGVDTQAADLAKAKTAFNATQNKAIAQRGTLETQAKQLGIDADEYGAFLGDTGKYAQLSQDYQPYASKLPANTARDAAIAQIAKAQKIDPKVLKNYFQTKEIEPMYKEATAAKAQQKAAQETEAAATAEAKAAQQAQLQNYANQLIAKSQARQAQNYAQTYNILSQNMPSPVGYAQPAQSWQAPTTTIGAGGDGGGRQMSPAQIAQMATMQRGGPPPQGIQQQAPVAVKRGGILRGR